MLARLYVQNYALIKELDVEFENGLTIITGETGAGKTILLGALSLILGNRADTSVLLEKKEKCIIEGTFRIADYDLEEFFRANDLDYEDISLIRREINPAGKSRAFINDIPVNLALLKELGDRLIDIHSQHQTLMLHDNIFQLGVIDSFAGTGKMISEYKKAYRTYRLVRAEYEELKGKYDQNKADLDYFSFQLKQLDEAQLIDGEQEDLEKEQEMLSHTGEIKESLSSASALFSSDSISILGMLREARSNILKIKDFLPEGGELASRTESAYIELSDIASEVERVASAVEADPERLIRINERLDTIYSLMQKHRSSNLGELIAKREEIRKIVSSLSTTDDKLIELGKQLAAISEEVKKLALSISGKRKAVSGDVERNISELLRQLGMPNAKFRIELKSDESNLRPTGIDNADFLFSANRQVEPEDLARIASGGELSRVMLSLKSVLTRNSGLPTIIFDEIDSGVSGEVADKVGKILSDMGKYLQVINITHLPQVAARGSRHFHVYKDDTANSTITRVRLLTSKERVIEVARLLSGSRITETAMKNAEELIRSALK